MVLGKPTVRLVIFAALILTVSPFAAPASALDLTGGIVNLVPAIVSVSLSTASLTPTAGSTTALTVTVIASDGNGFNDIASVTVEVLKPDGSTSHIAAGAATFSVGSALQATFTRTVHMKFHDAATSLLESYKVKVVATDSQAAAISNLASLATFTYGSLAALMADSSLVLGSTLQPGSTGSIQGLSVQNYGNVPIDLEASGTALTHETLDASLPVGSLRYSLDSGMSASTALTGNAATLGAFDLAAGASSSRDVYWRLVVPSASSQYVPPGTYSGSVTLSAVAA